MRVLAIGATGFIGAHVVRCLLDEGHEVAVLHRGDTNPDHLAGAEHIRTDRSALAEVRGELHRFAPEVVLDVIPYTEQQAQEVVEAFRGLAGHLVAVSSADVYRNYDGLRGKPTAPPDPVPLTEGAPLRETLYPYRGHDLPFAWAHDYEKILVERVVLGDPELPGTVLRLPAVYGPGDRQHRLRPYLRRMDDGRPAVLLEREQASWQWTRGYVENVAAAIALAVTDARAAGRVYNVGEENAATERQWVERIGAAAGWTGEIVQVPAELLPEQLRQPLDWRYHLACDTSRIRRELGYTEPVGLPDALDRTLEWERSQPTAGESPDYAAEDAVLRAIRS